MNELTVFLHQLLGPILLIVAFAFYAHRSFYVHIYHSLHKEPMMLLTAGMASLVIGMTLILKHQLWGNAFEIIITLFGWMAFFKGVGLLWYPKLAEHMTKKIVTEKYMQIIAGAVMVLGVVMIWVGYFA